MASTPNNDRAVKQPVLLADTVLKGGYCIGCGACASLPDSDCRIESNEYGQYQALAKGRPLSPEKDRRYSEVCPFSEYARDEDQIAGELFGQECQYIDNLGYYRAPFAGYVIEGPHRELGSSGGIGTWCGLELIRRQLVDHVVHVHTVAPSSGTRKDGAPVLFSYGISSSAADVSRGAKTRYYPVEMSEVIRKIRELPGRYAVLGLPCFIKAIRLLRGHDPIFRDRVQFCISLVCGHLKSSRFADLFAWQCGVPPGQLATIDFRKKLVGRTASDYGVELRSVNGLNRDPIVRPTREIIGSNWGHMFFSYKACDYCDDVVGETSDLSIGDAWLEEYKSDYRGTNVLVTRNRTMHDLLTTAAADGRIHLETIDMADVARSQRGNLRHRKEGLAYRLYLADQAKQWRPPKRVSAREDHLSASRKELYRLRRLISERTHVAFKEAVDRDDLEHFRRSVSPLMKRHKRLTGEPSVLRLIRRVGREIRKRLR